MKTFFVSLCFLIAIALVSCDVSPGVKGEGPLKTKSYSLDEVQELKLNGSFAVVLAQGEQEDVVIETNENLLEYIVIKQEGSGTVSISSTKALSSEEGIKIHIQLQELKRLESTGAVSITSEGTLQFDDLEIELSGAGATELQVNAGSLSIQMAGAGAAKLKGIANQLVAELSGVGALEASELEASHCTINISGVGGAEVYVTKKLIANISGLGGVEYCGNPPEIEKNISGLGGISSCDGDNGKPENEQV